MIFISVKKLISNRHKELFFISNISSREIEKERTEKIVDCGYKHTMEKIRSTFMNITFARPAALFERKTSRFFADRWKFSGNPKQSRKPRTSARRNVQRIGIVCSRERTRAAAVDTGRFRARAVEPKRRTGTTPGTFSSFNNGRSTARTDTNREKIKDVLAKSLRAALDFRAKKARVELQVQGIRRCARWARKSILLLIFCNIKFSRDLLFLSEFESSANV